MTIIAPELTKYWVEIAPYLTISNEEEYDAAVERLNALLDEVGDDESNPLYSLLDILGIIIEAYDKENYPLLDCHGVDALSYLMKEHNLSQFDIPEIGSQEIVSEILS